MTAFMARYDLRCPEWSGWSRDDLYATALDQAAFCDEHGFDALVLSEHHGVPDGYLPSPLIMAAAMVTRTSRIPINVAAILVALHDPLRLAEDIAVLDVLSRGRVSYVLALGYRQEEYAMFGRQWSGRGRRVEEAIRVLLRAWEGEPFDYEGRTVQVTPPPVTRPHPFLLYGGGSEAAAQRAARLGFAFSPQTADPELAEAFLQACEEAGTGPGFVMQPGPGPGVIFCSRDPEAFWERAGENLLHDARSYNSWHGDLESTVRDRSESVEEMRQAGVYVVLTPEELIERCRSGEIGGVGTAPLCGGMPAEPSWESLRLLADVVLPALAGTPG